MVGMVKAKNQKIAPLKLNTNYLLLGEGPIVISAAKYPSQESLKKVENLLIKALDLIGQSPPPD